MRLTYQVKGVYFTVLASEEVVRFQGNLAVEAHDIPQEGDCRWLRDRGGHGELCRTQMRDSVEQEGVLILFLQWHLLRK